jgi:hypothetical protein
MATQRTLSMASLSYNSPLAPFDDALRAIFSTPAQETLLQKTRHIMGDAVGELSDDELEVCITEFQHLIDYWLDTFEKDLFDGMTLHQLLREG